MRTLVELGQRGKIRVQIWNAAASFPIGANLAGCVADCISFGKTPPGPPSCISSSRGTRELTSVCSTHAGTLVCRVGGVVHGHEFAAGICHGDVQENSRMSQRSLVRFLFVFSCCSLGLFYRNYADPSAWAGLCPAWAACAATTGQSPRDIRSLETSVDLLYRFASRCSLRVQRLRPSNLFVLTCA
jgi:hypothetical protein